jgi:hypothetical protein
VLARCGPTLDQSFPSAFGLSAEAIRRGEGCKEKSREEQFEGIRRDSHDLGDVYPGVGEASWYPPLDSNSTVRPALDKAAIRS